MRVLQIIDSLSIGGSERMCVNIANQFHKDGIENAIVATHKGGPLQEKINPGIDVHILHKKHALDLSCFLKLLRIVRTYNPSIIHAHSSSIYWASLIKKMYPHIFIVWHDHFGMAESLKPSDRKPLHLVKSQINMVVCVNDLLMNWNKNHLQIDAKKLLVLNNFPSLNLDISASKTPNTILCIANFRVQKNIPNLLHALAKLKNEGTLFTCTLIGSVGDGVEYQKCLSIIQETHLTSQVTILTNNLAVEKYLATSAVGVLSSDSEGLPVTLLEYGLARLAVVCTQVGDCGKALGNGTYGWLVPPRDLSELASHIKYALLNQSEASEKAEQFHQEVLKNYSGDAFASNYFKQIRLLTSSI